MASDFHSPRAARPAVSDRWERWADVGAAHDADDQLRSRVIVILLAVTLACFGAMSLLLA